MGNFLTKLMFDFLVAFGVVFGGVLLGGIGAVLTLQPPTIYMQRIAENIKIWAVVAAIGGTIDPFRVIESNFLDGNLSPAIKQILYVIGAFMGAHLATKLVNWICNGGIEH
ncbi:YtrH family sporulation protein [Ferviditalea candida]|uniref:YtrH family sporulation protein n=1 Tax=Ferviditalea candida TaxID=3108399 RepID=A0ABU5ZDF9_9BACL|nr:YtrH family sporulation protein [Paenibacillaceae bacterium T2]